MARFRVVLTDQVFPDVVLERELFAGIDAELVVPGGGLAGVMAAARSADALLNTYMPIGRAEIEQLASCRIIARYGIGVDNIDLEAARQRGIVVTNVPDYSVEEVAVHTLALLLAALRRIPAGMDRATVAPWSLEGLRPIERLSELTIGVVGLGRIGRRVIAMLRPFGSRILAYDPYVTAPLDGVELVDQLDQLLSESQIVTLHLPVTEQTRGLIGARELALMPGSAILVNASRGALVSTPAVADALRSGHLRAAALDVLEHEAADASVLAGIPGAIVTPHMAYYSESSLRESQRKAATQIVKVLSGETPDYPVG